ncbi:recombinase family protein [Microvirga sp. 2TAF3]|uniref:recombinase family protein n=1 Tax=Microvirga sp. 2TAF3 TaxID=3233014 RepID=UPI003F9DD763
MPKAYSYVRFSTPSQAQGDSLRRQLEAARAWCLEHNLELDDSLRDLGVSAWKGSNREEKTALGRFLERVESGEVEPGSCLIIESLDRLSREAVSDAAYLLLGLVRKGVRVVTLADRKEYSKEDIDSRGGVDLMISVGIMARANEESNIKSLRIGKVWSNKRERARAEGHKVSGATPAWIRLDGQKFVILEDRAEVVRRIFREAVAGRGKRSIAKGLNEEEVPSLRGKRGWWSSTVDTVLRNRAAFGEYQPHIGRHANRKPEGEPIKGYYPAVISEELFWRAQEAIDRRKGASGRRGAGVAHLLTGLVKCECGGPMRISSKGKPPKGARYYECNDAVRHFGCDNRQRWRVDKIERRLLRVVSYLDVAAVLGDAEKERVDRVTPLRTKLAAVEARRGRLIDLYVDGDNAVRDLIAQAAEEAARLKEEIGEAERAVAIETADPGIAARLEAIKDLQVRMDAAADAEKTVIRTALAEQMRRLVVQVRFDKDLGVMALLTPKSGVRDAPWVVGARNAVRWRAWLNDDDPHGIEDFEDLKSEPPSHAPLERFVWRATSGPSQG